MSYFLNPSKADKNETSKQTAPETTADDSEEEETVQITSTEFK